jgi:NAD(P)-dependent dehydrogenase (short-subunit alcohol dehydrogenase family)
VPVSVTSDEKLGKFGMKRFTNKNVLITGAASGIGHAAATRIASEGGNLALLDVNGDKLAQVAHELSEKYAVNVIYEKCNVADFEEVKAAIDLSCEQLGGIQALSHNAGILRCYNTHEMTLEQWNEVISVNLTGTFNVNRHALRHLLKNKHSYVVNTSSIAAYYRHPWMSAYSATKGAIKSFTRSLFIEYAQQGLRANCVLPGSIDTPLGRSFQIPEGADPKLLKSLVPFDHATLVSPESVAAAIAFLASDDAFHINGTEISIDGGKI